MSSPAADSPKEGSSRARSTSSKTMMNSKDEKSLKALIKKLKKHKVAWPFTEPVDPVKLDIPDYFEIIKHPMDFGTIEKKLDKHLYSTPEQMQNDVNLVFNNANKYNPPGSDICLMVDQLKKYFDLQWAGIKFGSAGPTSPASSTPAVPSDKVRPKTPSTSSSSTPSKTPQPQSQTSATNQKKRKSEVEETTPRSENKTKSSADSMVPMSFEEKKLLGGKINRLPQNQLGKVVDIIRKAISSIDNQLAVEENIEIDMEELDIGTLRRLEKFVNHSLAAAANEPRETANPGEAGEVKANPQKKRKEQ